MNVFEGSRIWIFGFDARFETDEVSEGDVANVAKEKVVETIRAGQIERNETIDGRRGEMRSAHEPLLGDVTLGQ